MTNELRPIRSESDYDAALVELERLWGAASGTVEGDRLDASASVIHAYEDHMYPMGPDAPRG